VLITKYFIFAHVPKTGGTFLRNVCAHQLPADWILSDDREVPHLTVRKIPEEHAGLPIFGVVRNPWDWYVSWYHFTVQNFHTLSERQKGTWAPIFGEGGTTFREAVTAACTGKPLPGQDPGWIRRLGVRKHDLYTAWHIRTLGDPPPQNPLEIGRFENLRVDFLKFLERQQIPVGDHFVSSISNALPQVDSKHEEFRSYYDPELRELVRSKNLLVDEFGYTFD
jgi:hypothetical protein